jgi:hypothetical protein
MEVTHFSLIEVSSLEITRPLAVRLHLPTEIRIESGETADHHRYI